MGQQSVAERTARLFCGALPWVPAVLVALLLALIAGGCGSQSSATDPTGAAYDGDQATVTSEGGQDTTSGPDTGPDTGDGYVSTSNPRVELQTTLGAIVVELDPTAAPISVENFLAYVQDGSYDGTIFHRVIPGFMAQGGGFTPDMNQKAGRPPIKNEAGNGLKNRRGTLAMARTMVVDSATAQFFVNVADNSFLDHTANTPQGYGYAVFGTVVSGMEVVDVMVASPTHSVGQFQDVPQTPIVIERATLLPAE
ncbi:MAG: peptidylprolyl isomerase [Thermoleophilia bacterium]